MRPFGPGRAITPGVRVLAHLHRSYVLDVYDAWSEHRACRVVAKVLRPDRRGDAAARSALVREGELLERLAHPHLVRAYEVHDGERPAVVLETLGGETLARMIERAPLAPPELSELARQLLSALRYLHAEGILHLDLKPSNVVAEAGRARLLDLSIARPPGRVDPGLGTWCNRAPEQERGGEVGPAADVWGLGTVLYEAATGANPFFERGAEAQFPQLDHRAAAVRACRRLPPELARLIDACLEPEAERRPTVTDLLAATGAQAGVPVTPQ